MTNGCAYLLVVHGSRSPQYKIYLKQLAAFTQQQLNSEGIVTELATSYLELAQESLAQKIIDFATICTEKGYSRLKILPLFLFSGTHVLQDIPHELNLARDFLAHKSTIDVELLSHLGSDPSIIDLLNKKYQENPSDARILITHGTRLSKGKNEAHQVAQILDAQLAFWSMNPFFAEIVDRLVQERKKSIAILPYFLFLGKITSAIATQMKELHKKYPDTELKIISPLGATPELAEIIVKQLTKPLLSPEKRDTY